MKKCHFWRNIYNYACNSIWTRQTGKNLCRQLEEMKIEYSIIDVNTNESNISGDVIIDFSTAQATDRLLEYALSRKTPLVIATTGQSQVQLDMIKNALMIIPIMKQSNFSFGIFALKNILKQCKNSFEEWDCDIVEYHRKNKLDSPSGTAKELLQILPQAKVHSIRAGTICGKHEIISAIKTKA